MMGSGTTKNFKTAFNEEVDFGANINFSASGASASSSKYSGRVLELMADGALNQYSRKQSLTRKSKLIEGLKSTKSVCSSSKE
jgi:hypothetical protein